MTTVTYERPSKNPEPTLFGRMWNWLTYNSPQILSGAALFALAEAFNITNIWDEDPFREGMENTFGPDFFLAEPFIDFHGENFINIPGLKGNKMYDLNNDGLDDTTGMPLDWNHDGVSDNPITINGEKQFNAYIDQNNDGLVDWNSQGINQLTQDVGGTGKINYAWTKDGFVEYKDTTP